MKALCLALFLAHAAPSGWEYPKHCCGEDDCHPVPCAEVFHEGFYWKWRGFHFSESQVYLSGDSECHVCIGQAYPLMPKTVTRCIFIPHSPIS